MTSVTFNDTAEQVISAGIDNDVKVSSQNSILVREREGEREKNCGTDFQEFELSNRFRQTSYSVWVGGVTNSSIFVAELIGFKFSVFLLMASREELGKKGRACSHCPLVCCKN